MTETHSTEDPVTAIDRMASLRTVLDGLVPLHMMIQERRGRLGDRAEECADLIASHGDALEHGRQSSAATLNALAAGIAVLCLTRREGVLAFGGHWCRDHSRCGAA